MVGWPYDFARTWIAKKVAFSIQKSDDRSPQTTLVTDLLVPLSVVPAVSAIVG
jgi:hypothetical protein